MCSFVASEHGFTEKGKTMTVVLLITPTEDGSFRETMDNLEPFFIYDGIETKWTSDRDSMELFSARYQQYREDRTEEISRLGWLGRCLRLKPASFKSWLLSEGVLFQDKLPQTVYDFGRLGKNGEVASVRSVGNYDEFDESGGLIHGERISSKNIVYQNFLDDGKPLPPFHRQRLMLSTSILQGDAQDLAINIWQHWERRYDDQYAVANKKSFEAWRQMLAQDRTSFPEQQILYDSSLLEIPEGCTSRWEFVNSALMVECDAIIKDGLWWETGDSWADHVAWATFVNTTILGTPKTHWLHTLGCLR